MAGYFLSQVDVIKCKLEELQKWVSSEKARWSATTKGPAEEVGGITSVTMVCLSTMAKRVALAIPSDFVFETVLRAQLSPLESVFRNALSRFQFHAPVKVRSGTHFHGPHFLHIGNPCSCWYLVAKAKSLTFALFWSHLGPFWPQVGAPPQNNQFRAQKLPTMVSPQNVPRPLRKVNGAYLGQFGPGLRVG